jgi:hypothetical protein
MTSGRRSDIGCIIEIPRRADAQSNDELRFLLIFASPAVDRYSCAMVCRRRL